MMNNLITLLLNTMSIVTSVALMFIAMCVIVQGGIESIFAIPFILLAVWVEIMRVEGKEFNV